MRVIEEPALAGDGCASTERDVCEVSPGWPLSPRMLALVLTVVLSLLPRVLWARSSPGEPLSNYSTFLFASDLFLGALLLLSVRPALSAVRARRLGVGAALWLGIAVISVVALAVHPSLQGAATVFRLAGTFAIALTLADHARRQEGRTILVVLGVAGVLEAVLGMAQAAHRGGLGLRRLGEMDLYVHFGPRPGPQGTMVHPYILNGLALLTAFAVLTLVPNSAKWKRLLLVAAVAVSPVGFTYSRAGVLGLVLALAVLGYAALHKRARVGLALLALVVGVGIPALAWRDGWAVRATQSTTSDISTGRVQLFRQSLRLISNYPLFGVGPGNYVRTLSERPDICLEHSDGVYQPVHVVPLLIAAESGVAAGLFAVALLMALAWKAMRTSPWALALFLALLPFCLLDHFLYSFPQGLVMMGLWIGVLDGLVAGRQQPMPYAGHEHAGQLH